MGDFMVQNKFVPAVPGGLMVDKEEIISFQPILISSLPLTPNSC